MSLDNFTAAFNYLSTHAAASRLEVQPEWHNNGYYSRLAMDRKNWITPGSLAFAVDKFERRLIVIGTPIGNIVLFDRYGTESNVRVVVVNYPHPVVERLAGGHGQMSEERIEQLLGGEHELYRYNFGYHLAKFITVHQTGEDEHETAPVQNTAEDSRELGKPISG